MGLILFIRHMVTETWVNIGLGNGLLPDGTKPLPEPILTNYQSCLMGIHLKAISLEMLEISIPDMPLKNDCHQTSNISCTESENLISLFLVSSCSCLCPSTEASQVLSRE